MTLYPLLFPFSWIQRYRMRFISPEAALWGFVILVILFVLFWLLRWMYDRTNQ